MRERARERERERERERKRDIPTHRQPYITEEGWTQLKEKHFQTLEDAMMEAKDREKWRAVVQDRIFLADNGLHQ